MAKVPRINWEAAAKDQVPCYFWDGEEKPEKPFVCRLKGFDEKSLYHFKGIQIGISISTRHCDFIREEDRLKYTEYEYIGRDNLIAALKECKPIKMEVTPDESAEIQEIAIGIGYRWKNDLSKNISITQSKQQLYFYDNKIIAHGFDRCYFVDHKNTEYFPATDTFAQPEKKYRACKDWEEFSPFMGKIAKDKTRENIVIITGVDFDENGALYSEWWFQYFTLLDGSPIGVEVE